MSFTCPITPGNAGGLSIEVIEGRLCLCSFQLFQLLEFDILGTKRAKHQAPLVRSTCKSFLLGSVGFCWQRVFIIS